MNDVKITSSPGKIIFDKKDTPFKRKFNRQKSIMLILVPGVIWYLIFKYLPFIGAFAAFTDYGTKADISFVGLYNFQRLFHSPGFWTAFKNTVLLSVYNLIFFFPLPIILALLMNEYFNVKIKRLIQFVVYIPHFFSWVVVGSIFVVILSPQSGPVNELIKFFGGKEIYFMSSTKWFRSVLVTSGIWRDVGYQTVIYIATIATIDPQLYEAATIDGAGYWLKMKYVTLPLLKSTIATVLLLSVARILQIFDQVFVMYNPTVYSVSDVLNTYSFAQGLLNGNVGYATAVSLFTAVISALLVIGCNFTSKKLLNESIL